MTLKPIVLIILAVPLLSGCDLVLELFEIPNPQKETQRREAEGRAIGGACRHAGRSLEDCYLLNPAADKSSVFMGWREMNDYMMKNSIPDNPPKLPRDVPGQDKPAQTPSDAGEPPVIAPPPAGSPTV